MLIHRAEGDVGLVSGDGDGWNDPEGRSGQWAV